VLKSALDGGHPFIAAAYLALLSIIFVGMLAIVLGMAQPGDRGVSDASAAGRAEPASAVMPPLALAAVVLLLGLYVPPALRDMLARAADMLGTTR
jgi:hydrogenase-4 component F